MTRQEIIELLKQDELNNGATQEEVDDPFTGVEAHLNELIRSGATLQMIEEMIKEIQEEERNEP